MSGETLQVVLVLALVVIVFFGFVRELLPPDIVAMLAVAVLLVTGILSVDETLKVFSNPAPITIGGLLIMSAALERTGVIERLARFVIKINWRSPTTAMVAMAVAVAVLSAFVNNTPLVVLLTPLMIALAHSMKAAPSRFLIPLSYAAIMGGTCTLIGTSTNIIVDGVAQRLGMAPFGMFEILAPGLVMAAIGIVYLWIFGRWLLPDRQSLAEAIMDLPRRQFLAEVLVSSRSPLIGRTLSEAGLSRAKGVHVIDVIRDEQYFDPEHGEPTLRAGDRLVIRSHAGDVLGLRDTGSVVFSSLDPEAIEPIASRNAIMMEGIVGPNSRFVGQRVSDLNLRRLYGTYILAIHRQNEALHGNFDQVRLAFGDALLLEGPADGLKRLFDTHELVNLSHIVERPLRPNKAPIAVCALLLVMLLAALEVMPIAGLVIVGAVVVVAFGCIEVDEAYKAIEWRMLMLIFGMLAVGRAMESTGAADLVVDAMTGVIAQFGATAILSMLYAVTSLVTAFMSNNASAILLTPIAIGMGEQLGIDPRPLVIAVMFASSADFSTPIGYQTNTFVYNAGGYRFVDFVRIGLPLNILNWIAASFLIPYFWPLR